MYVTKSLLNKYPEDTYKKEVVSKIEDERGHFVTNVSFVDCDPPEFEFIPAEVFDTEALKQSGNLAEVQKVRFTPGMDIDMLDRAQDSMLRSMENVEASSIISSLNSDFNSEPEPESESNSELKTE